MPAEVSQTDHFWTKNYPAGVPASIDYSGYTSCVQLFDEAIGSFRGRKAFTNVGVSMTYDELDKRANAFAAWLQWKGLERGARVAIMMPNLLQYPVAILGILRAGCVVVNVNPLYTPRELEHQLKDSGAEAIVVLENFAHVLAQVVAHTHIRHVVLTAVGDSLGGAKGLLYNFVVRNIKKMVPPFELANCTRFNVMLGEARGKTLKPVLLQPDDVAFLQYTGGTTGISKGATLSHRNVVANVLQSEAWMQPGLARGLPVEQMVCVCALPLYHIFALTVVCLLSLKTGALVVLITNPRGHRRVLKRDPAV